MWITKVKKIKKDIRHIYGTWFPLIKKRQNDLIRIFHYKVI